MELRVNAASPLAATPKYFGLELYPPQAAVLHSMLELEANKRMVLAPQTLDEMGVHLPNGSSQLEVRFDAAMLSAPFGFGKTLVVVALIATEHVPKTTPIAVNLLGSNLNAFEGHRTINRAVVRHAKSVFDQKREYAFLPLPVMSPLEPELEWCPPRVIRSTLVMVPSAIMTQWRENLQEYAPHLNVYYITGAQDLRNYRTLLLEGRSAEFHLVLLREGTMSISGELTMHPPIASAKPPGSALTVPSITAVTHATRGVAWRRLIIDDFDTSKMPAGAQIPPAQFTWYVSATDRVTFTSLKPEGCEGASKNWEEGSGRVLRGLLPGTWPLRGVCLDDVMRTMLTISCDKNFYEKSYPLPAPLFYDIVVQAPAALQLLQGLGLDDDVYQALNSGAVDEAAKKLGFHCSTMSELIARILGQNRAKLAAGRAMLAEFNSLMARYQIDLDAQPGPTGPTRMTAARASAIGVKLRKALTADEIWASLEAGEAVPTDCSNVGSLPPKAAEELTDARDKITSTVRECERCISRLRENFSEGTCQVCLLEWSDLGDESAHFITRCCATIMCADCALDGTRKALIDRCPNASCFAPMHGNLLTFGKDLVSSTSDSKGLAAAVDTAVDEAILFPADGGQLGTKAQVLIARIRAVVSMAGGDQKIEALLRIIHGLPLNSTPDGEPPDDKVPIEEVRTYKMPKNLLGVRGEIVEPPKNVRRRVLIFSEDVSGTRHVSAVLAKFSISHAILLGSTTTRGEIIRQYRESKEEIEILLVTGSRDCAGAHLPETTEEIFYHRHRDASIWAQLVGRAQRAGRSHSLKVYTLCYRGIEAGS